MRPRTVAANCCRLYPVTGMNEAFTASSTEGNSLILFTTYCARSERQKTRFRVELTSPSTQRTSFLYTFL